MPGINLRNFVALSLALHILAISIAPAFLEADNNEFAEPKPIEVGIISTYTKSPRRANPIKPPDEQTPRPEKRVVKPVTDKKEKREITKKKEVAKKVIEPVEQNKAESTQDEIFEPAEKTTVTNINKEVAEYISNRASQESELAYPDYKINPKPKYPMIARRKGYEGVVMLKVWVMEDGRVGKLEIQKSSNYEMLDRSAMEAVEDWVFVPGKKGGKPIPGWVTVPIKFQLSSG